MNRKNGEKKVKLSRIVRIDAAIRSGTYPNSGELAKKLEVSTRTILRDIDFLKYSYDAPIEYDFKRRGFYYTEKTFHLTAAYATADDLFALGMAKKIMELYKDTPVHDAALNLMENISAPLYDDENTEWFKDRIIIPKTAAAYIDEETWKGIVEALRRNSVITFQYDGNVYLPEAGKKLNIRRVRPYQLLFDRSDWYLFAYDEDRNETRIFALSRITNIALTNTKFSIPRNFDYRSLEGLSYFAIFSGAKIYRFAIAINGDTRWIKEHLWADDQKIKETRNGIEISFTSNQFERVLNWVLSLTPYARPLAPKILVDRWRKAIREAAKIAK